MGKAMRKKIEGKANRAKEKGERLSENLKKVRKHYNKLRKSMKNGKVGDAEIKLKRAQNAYDEAKKLCARLKKEGEDVPDEGEKDVSAPGAWKAPGLRAAKARDAAKEELRKAKAAWDKLAVPAAAKEERLKALKEKMKGIEQQQQEVEEAIKSARKANKAKA